METENKDYISRRGHYVAFEDVTKREYFAAMAMQSLLSRTERLNHIVWDRSEFLLIAKEARLMANALLSELESNQ